jgi:hypothetical protein
MPPRIAPVRARHESLDGGVAISAALALLGHGAARPTTHRVTRAVTVGACE